MLKTKVLQNIWPHINPTASELAHSFVVNLRLRKPAIISCDPSIFPKNNKQKKSIYKKRLIFFICK